MKNEIEPIQNVDDDIRLEHDDDGKEIYVFDPYNPLNKDT